MKERPILFSSDMVRAILDGRKTQTRRIIKPQPHWIKENNSVAHIGKKVGNVEYLCKYGEVGDRLWVREPWAAKIIRQEPNALSREDVLVKYIVDGKENLIEENQMPDSWLLPMRNPSPSICMPRWASRITLEITGVRVDRLQDISEEDAKEEGLSSVSKDGSLFKYGIPDLDGLPGTDNDGWPWVEWETNPVSAYKKLWESINGKGSWEENPLVWVISFRKI